MNVDPVVAEVVQSGRATLRELKECYSMHDLFDIWEIVHTEKYNEWVARERARNAAKLRGK